MKKIVLLAFVLVLLSTAMIGRFVRPAVAQGTIYIRADGSVEGTTYVMTVDNVTYTFTDNINDSIVVERSNIIIDGKGYTIQGSGSGPGFYLSGINNVTVKNTNIKNFTYGVRLDYSSNYNNISGNNITANNGDGIVLLTSSNYNSISGNNITNNWRGITLIIGSSNNSVSGNNIANNEYGIIMDDSSNYNTISGNNIANSYLGISLQLFSADNTIYHNNFIDNTINTNDPHTNTWDDGYPSGGNYWSNYAGVDANMDGIGDSSYETGYTSIDHYPLMGMFSDFSATLEEETYHVTTVCNSAISSFEFDEVNRIIRFNVTGEEGVGFCRVCVPHDLMEPPRIVTVDGYAPQYVNYTLHDNGTHRWIYFTYQHSTHKVEIIPEFPTWTSMLLMLVVLTVALAIYKRRLLKTPTQ